MFDNPTPREVSWLGGSPAEGAASSLDRPGPLSERSRGRLFLRGQLDDVGLDDLLASLGSRGKTCIVEVRSAMRRGEVVLDRGRIVRARAEGLSPASDVETVLATLRGFYRAVFDVLSLEDVADPISSRSKPSSVPPPRPASRPPPPMLEGNGTDVALAAAVMNACGSYTRKWLGPKVTTSILMSSWARIYASHPALDAFKISQDGMVSVSGIERAKSAIPRAVASWVFAVFEAGAMWNAQRFQRYFVPEMLGGLMRLLDKGGWGDAFREGGIR